MQNIKNATRVVILVETPDRRYGWEVLQPRFVQWDFFGVGPQGTEATLTARGVFHRMTTANPFDEHTRLWADEIAGELKP